MIHGKGVMAPSFIGQFANKRGGRNPFSMNEMIYNNLGSTKGEVDISGAIFRSGKYYKHHSLPPFRTVFFSSGDGGGDLHLWCNFSFWKIYMLCAPFRDIFFFRRRRERLIAPKEFFF